MKKPIIQDKNASIINIAVIGGGPYCKELLEKTTMDYSEKEVNARMKAVADPDPNSLGILTAKKLGLKTVSDYHELYDPDYNIQLFIVLTPEQEILEDILRTKPPHIRVQSYHVFNVFWKAISIEEQKLRQRNEEIETILNGIQDLICVISPDFKIVDVNDAFTRTTGYSRDYVVGRDCFEILHNNDHPCEPDERLCPLKEVVKHRRHVRQVMKALPRANNNPRYYEVDMFPILEKDGTISEFIEISRDITLRLKEEEEITRRLEEMVEIRTRQLKETHDKLLHQDKMASLGKLAASVVHEINNPIAGVLNLTMLIKRIIEEGSFLQRDIDKFKQYLDLMEAETRRTSRIVSNLLTFSRQSKIEPDTINLNKLIDQTLILNSNLLKIHGISVEKKYDSNLPEIVGSSDQLQQIFMNFISNAAEAMESTNGGVLNIETSYSPGDGKVRIRFKDSGIGIPHENLTRIFEPFFTTKKGKGVGLGLSVAYGIVQEHGGSMDVQSDVGKGTILEIELPLKNEPVNFDQGGQHEYN